MAWMLRYRKGDPNSVHGRARPHRRTANPCSCAMDNLYRFVEPQLLFLAKKRTRSYGYDVASELREFAFADAVGATAAVCRPELPIDIEAIAMFRS
jgi:hypothetical protein